MLGIEFYCGNYDELRRMKELGGVETHCSRCKLISEQDLVKLLLCFYRFTALPRGKVFYQSHFEMSFPAFFSYLSRYRWFVQTPFTKNEY